VVPVAGFLAMPLLQILVPIIKVAGDRILKPIHQPEPTGTLPEEPVVIIQVFQTGQIPDSIPAAAAILHFSTIVREVRTLAAVISQVVVPAEAVAV